LSLFKAIRGFLFSGGAKICDDLIFFVFFLYMLQKTLIRDEEAAIAALDAAEGDIQRAVGLLLG
jgi:hypothetical protein